MSHSLHPVERAIAQSTLLPHDGVVVAAVSGGADSMALVEVLRAQHPRVVVAHFDHRLRDGSARDAKLVTSYARRHRLQVALGVWRRTSDPGSIEQAARDARYEFLASVADTYGASCIATAHTQSDQIETVVMRVLRGAGRAGLAGIPERRGSIVRPLLAVTRAQTRDYCESRGVAFVDDPTNDDVRFLRNRIRHEVLPALRAAIPSIDGDLLRVAERARREQAAFAQRFDMSAIVREETYGVWTLDVAAFASLDDEDATALLRDALAHAGLARDVGRVHYERLLELVRDENAGSAADVPHIRARREHDALVLHAGAPAHTDEDARKLAVPGSARVGDWIVDAEFVAPENAHAALAARQDGRHVAYFDAEALGDSLTVRSPRAGDSLRPFGLGGTKKLSDVFVDGKIARRHRERHVVVEGRSICWVPGVVRADVAPVVASTTHVVRLSSRRIGANA
jgi:tRNA(Ile)-lysidine synthase